MVKYLKKEISETKVLLKNIPPVIFSFFILTLFVMNLLANKSLNIPISWLKLDAGYIISWFLFLTMDILTKHFGPKAATKLSFLATGINLVICLIMFLASILPGMWGEAYLEGHEAVINNALNKTFGGTWYVIVGSTVAFAVSSVVNNFTNYAVGKAFKRNPDGFFAYIIRSYFSTAVSQFVDNLLFSMLVGHIFFGWSFKDCFFSAFVCMGVELVLEAFFSPIGYKVCEKWRKEKVGEDYFKFVAKK